MTTAYDAYNVIVNSPDGELVTLTAIKLDIPQYLKMERGVLSKQWVDIKGSMVIKVETLLHFASLAKSEGSWQDMTPIEFIEYSITPVGADPFHVTLKKVALVVDLPDLDKLAGGGVEVEISFFPAEVEINGTSILRKPRKGGI